jgi:hypothetical protein
MDIFEKLNKLVKMKTFEDIQEFEKLAWERAQTKSPESLKELISLFDDHCPHQEVMFGLLHIIESYPNDIYVKSVLQNIGTALSNCPEWADRIVNRILNDEQCQIIFRQNMKLADKKTLSKLFDLMDKESPHHRELIADLREELENTLRQ